MRIKTLVIVGLVLWAWLGVPAFAEQQYPTNTALQLVTKNNIGLIMENLGGVSASCGITKTMLEAAVRLPLSRNGFRISSGQPEDNDRLQNVDGSLYVVVDGMPSGAGGNPRTACAISVELDFLRELSILPNFPSHPPRRPFGMEDFDNRIYGASVWNRGTLMTGPSAELPRLVRQALEGFTEEWIAKWLIDNPQ